MEIETKHIIDIIDEVVDILRKTNTINTVTATTGNYYTLDFDAVNEYEVNDLLTLTTDLDVEFSNCKVTSINSDYQITVLNRDKTDISLVTSSKDNAPYFDFTNWESEAVNLLGQDSAIKRRVGKYPLIFLLLNINETRNNAAYHSSVDSINLYLITQTKPAQNDVWRHANTFPILRNLYDELIEALESHKNILVDNNHLNHLYKEIFFLDKSDEKQNKLNDYVDCIQLVFKDIRTKNKNKC